MSHGLFAAAQGSKTELVQMNVDTSKNKKVLLNHYLELLLNNRCARMTSTGESFGSVLLSYDGASIIVGGKRGARTLVKRSAITSIYEVV